jgi:hypothetical protein
MCLLVAILVLSQISGHQRQLAVKPSRRLNHPQKIVQKNSGKIVDAPLHLCEIDTAHGKRTTTLL